MIFPLFKSERSKKIKNNREKLIAPWLFSAFLSASDGVQPTPRAGLLSQTVAQVSGGGQQAGDAVRRSKGTPT